MLWTFFLMKQTFQSDQHIAPIGIISGLEHCLFTRNFICLNFLKLMVECFEIRSLQYLSIAFYVHWITFSSWFVVFIKINLTEIILNENVQHIYDIGRIHRVNLEYVEGWIWKGFYQLIYLIVLKIPLKFPPS